MIQDIAPKKYVNHYEEQKSDSRGLDAGVPGRQSALPV